MPPDSGGAFFVRRGCMWHQLSRCGHLDLPHPALVQVGGSGIRMIQDGLAIRKRINVVLNQYSICPICTTPDQPQEEPSPLDQATMVMPEEEIYRITVEWEKQYGFSGLWDYQVNAAFAAENGTTPYNAYIRIAKQKGDAFRSSPPQTRQGARVGPHRCSILPGGKAFSVYGNARLMVKP